MLRAKTSLHILADTQQWIDHATQFIFLRAQEAIRTRGRFYLCLAGGSTPKQIYERLSQGPFDKNFPWEYTHIFWGDERAVPADHPDSNYKMAHESWLIKVPIPEDHIHAIKDAVNPLKAAETYANKLHEHFATGGHTFDLTLLGLGDDGHTASLFPNTALLQESHRWVGAIYLKKLDVYRISLTLPALNRSRNIAFLVTGQKKQVALRQVFNDKTSGYDYPAKLIQPIEGLTHWLLDWQAAKALCSF